VILYGSDYWNGLREWIRASVLARGNVSAGDLALLEVVDEPDEVCRIVGAAASAQGRRRAR
jgi:predicted Rossmann-fold nucleotide-binding protein